MNWNQHYEYATWFVKNFGWNVKEHTTDRTDYDHKVILIKKTRVPRLKYYVLIHEIGHMLLRELPNYEALFEKHRGKYSSLAYRILLLEEEIAAWNLGEGIAKLFGWYLDETFYHVRASKLSTYMLWANNRRHPHKNYSTKAKT